MRPRALVGLGVFFVALLCALCGAVSPAAAAEPPAHVSVLTMGPGDHPFTRFGHNALLLEWGDRSLVYNFGTFEFDGLRGVSDFMAGRFRYWLSLSSLERTVRSYGAARRSLTAQELALTAGERAELAAALAENALPAHRYYDYDYYRDNCSTRVRDAVDRILRGQLRREVSGPGRRTFRQHTLHLVSTSPWLYFGLNLALGAGTDRPTTRWEELFLPEELHRELGRARRTLDGREVPLVRDERTFLAGEPRPSPNEPPTARWFLYATSIGALLVALGRSAGRPALRVAFGLGSAVLGGVIGLLGTALAIFALSKHWAAHQNPSLLACPPWALALTVLGVRFALGRPGSARLISAVAGASLISSALLLLLAVIRGSTDALPVEAPFVSIWGSWFYAAWRATRSGQR